MMRSEVLRKALLSSPQLIEITGGEPLLQPAVFPLMQELCDAGRTVLVETSGEADISQVDLRVHKIVDLKGPSSGESHRNRWSNLEAIRATDEIKFVLADRTDYDWMCAVLSEKKLVSRTPTILVSPVFGRLPPQELVRWVLEDAIPVRVQVQLHKYIWGGEVTGV